jgi:hypothetical protein
LKAVIDWPWNGNDVFLIMIPIFFAPPLAPAVELEPLSLPQADTTIDTASSAAASEPSRRCERQPGRNCSFNTLSSCSY